MIKLVEPRVELLTPPTEIASLSAFFPCAC